MTISSQPIVKTYACNGATTAFSFPYRILAASDIVVYRIAADDADDIGSVLSDGLYTVTGVGSDAGVTVTTDTAYADGKIRIWLAMSIVQLNTYADNGAFPAQSHEDALDRLTLLDAMRREEFTRTDHYPLGRLGRVMPPVDQMASMLWATDLNGGLTFVPTIKGDDITTIDAASIFFDHNGRAEPRLMIDVTGQGSTISPDVGGGGFNYAVMGMQDDVDLVDDGVQRFFISSVFRGQVDGTPNITNKRSRFQMGINVRSEVDAVYVPEDGEVAAYYMPQEVGALSLTCTARAGTNRAKIDTLVVSAREEFGLAAASKGVAIQAITVRTTQGPDPFDRSQITTGEDGEDGATVDEPTDEPAGGRQGSFTLRLNAGTVKVDEQPVFGGYRSWAAILASGRAGYYSGVVLGKKHTSGVYTDPESVGGWGGIWGGWSFCHENTFGVMATDDKPGWIAGGKDTPDGPCDIVSATVGGLSAAYFVDGVRVLRPRMTGWAVATGTATRTTFDTATVTLPQLAERLKALIDDLHATAGHGLIGTT